MPRKRNGTRCSLWWCTEPMYGRGLCMRHYRQSVRHEGNLCLATDARVMLSYIQAVQVLLVNITEHCWTETEAGRVCKYCHQLGVHAPACIVNSALELRERVTDPDKEGAEEYDASPELQPVA